MVDMREDQFKSQVDLGLPLKQGQSLYWQATVAAELMEVLCESKVATCVPICREEDKQRCKEENLQARKRVPLVVVTSRYRVVILPRQMLDLYPCQVVAAHRWLVVTFVLKLQTAL
jgi:hypothetical protein